MALNNDTLEQLDTYLGNGGAAKIVALINSGTALDCETRARLAAMLGGIGEATAFESGANSAGTMSVAMMNHMERMLHGRGAAEDIKTAVTNSAA